jgi:type IV pilus assembly protein PilO
MEQLVDRISSTPTVVKVAAVAALAFVVTALNYFVIGLPSFGDPVATVEKRLKTAHRDQKRLDQEYAEKQAIANNLNEYRREKELLDVRLKEALSELPEDKNIDELLQALQEGATRAGLDILTIEPQGQVYARIPIPMSVQGNYHEVASFLDAIGRLRRIVNVSNLSFDQPKDLNGRLVLNAKFLATTFMFVQPKDGKDAASGGAKR